MCNRNLICLAWSRVRSWIGRYWRGSNQGLVESRPLFAIVVVQLAGMPLDYASYEQAGEFLSVHSDPADGRLVNSASVDSGGRSKASVLGEWRKAGDYQGWQVDHSRSHSVARGVLSAVIQADPAHDLQLTLEDITPEIDLDLGYNDFVQVRMALPVGYDQPVRFRYGTTVRDGFSSEREWYLPAEEIIADGAMHVYRFDVGLEVLWRDGLDDLQIAIPAGRFVGKQVRLDYIEAGDQPNDVLVVNENIVRDPKYDLSDLKNAQSKHFTTWYSSKTSPDFDPGENARTALRLLEESSQYYNKVLGYFEPYYGEEPRDYRRPNSAVPDYNATRHKVNHLTWKIAFDASSHAGFGFLNIDERGLRGDGFAHTVYHELAHVFQMAQPCTLEGGHWESHANYMSESYSLYSQKIASPGGLSNVTWNVVTNQQLAQDARWLIYQDLRLHASLADFGERFGLQPHSVAQLWQVGGHQGGILQKLELLLPEGVKIQDMLGDVLRHWAILDLPSLKDSVAARYLNPKEKPQFDFLSRSHLIPSADRPGWYRVPFERAPQRFALTKHELVPSSNRITVEMRGIDVAGDDGDWRWSLFAMGKDGRPRYSDVWGPGVRSFQLLDGESRVMLVVVATPHDLSLDVSSSNSNTRRFDKHVDRLSFPYEVRIEGARPTTNGIELPESEGDFHVNPDGSPGGWVSRSAIVVPTAHVDRDARVLRSARVMGMARVENHAVITDKAVVRDHAVVSGSSYVFDSAVIRGRARVRDRARVAGDADVSGNALLEGYSFVGQQVVVTDDAIVRGNAHIVKYGSGKSIISGTAIAEADYAAPFSLDDGVHQGHTPWGAWFEDYFAATQKKPRGLVASYRVEAPDGDVLWDEFGAQHALLRGRPLRVRNAGKKNDVLELNGTDQYAVLDRSQFDMVDGSFGVWVKPAAQNRRQTILFGGSQAGDYLRLDAGDGRGRPVLEICTGTSTDSIVSTHAIPSGVWSHLAFTFGQGSMKFYVNGRMVGAKDSSATPTNVLGSHDLSTPEHLYLGRGAAGDYFQGQLDDMRFYNVELTPKEIRLCKGRRGSILGTFLTDHAQEFDGSSTIIETGVPGGQERTLAVSVRPDRISPSRDFQGIVDSLATKGLFGGFGNGIGIVDGEFAVRLGRSGPWRTGVKAKVEEWQDLVLVLDGAGVTLYVDKVERAFRAYGELPTAVAGQNYRIGMARDFGRSTYFAGQIRNVTIHDRAIPVTQSSTNTPPVAKRVRMATKEGSAVTMDPTANDADRDYDALVVMSVTDGAFGKVTHVDNAVTYTPNPQAFGVDTFEYTVTDGRGGTDTARVVVDVAPGAERRFDVYGAFDVSVEARFDNLYGGSWQRIFDFGNSENRDGIILTQEARTNDMAFIVSSGGDRHMILAENAITQEVFEVWRASVDSKGFMRLYRGDTLVAEGKGTLPRAVPRRLERIGGSNTSGHTPMIGVVRDFQLRNSPPPELAR